MPEVEVDNQHIYYEEVGDGPHTVLLIPGFAGIVETDFAPIFPTLNKTNFRWICLDPPGYGRSRPQDCVVDDEMFDRIGTVIGKFMLKLGIVKYSVVGWSQGGAFAVKLADHFSENVNKLIFWGTTATINKRVVGFQEFMESLDNWPKRKLEMTLKYFEEEYLLNQCRQATVYVKRCLEKKHGRFIDPLPSLKCPTLILYGKKDRLINLAQPLAWKSAIENSRIYYFEEGKHHLHLQFTEEFVKVVEEFLEE